MVDLASRTQDFIYEEHFDMSQKATESSVMRMATLETDLADRNSNPSKREQRVLGPGSRAPRALSSSARR